MSTELEAPRSEQLRFESYSQMMAEIEKRGWGDGLPVAPPTHEAVAEFVEATGRAANEVIADIPPTWGEATVEKVAINAVMAGCKPDYMPVIVTALDAMLEPGFNLYGLQATTHPAAPMILVSGPEVERLGINSGYGAFGPGWRANATIGRAIRLILLNLGGARPGLLDRATQGQPSKYTYCIAENDNDTPWEPYRVSLGFKQEDSIVVVASLESPHNINDHGSYSGEQILTTIAGTMATGGTNNLYLGGDDHPFLFLGPEHARQIADDGFGRKDIQRFLFERARTAKAEVGEGQWNYLRQRHRANPRYHELGLDDADLASFPIVTQPEDICIVVVGGAGKHSSFAPSTGALSNLAIRKLP